MKILFVYETRRRAEYEMWRQHKELGGMLYFANMTLRLDTGEQYVFVYKTGIDRIRGMCYKEIYINEDVHLTAREYDEIMSRRHVC